MEAPKSSSYSTSHRAYYARNKDSILEKYREKKPYKAFYERNKERLRAKALDRYYQKKLSAELDTTSLPMVEPEGNSPPVLVISEHP